MTLVDGLGYVADAAILAVYFLTIAGRPVVWFHRANALGAPAVIVSEVVVGAWPALVLTASFGLIGAVGWVRCRAWPDRGA